MSARRILGLFPGQGSQKVGMGKELVERSPIASRLFDAADRVLGFSLSTFCFEGPAEKLTSTAIAQPAILTVSTICHQIALDHDRAAFTLSAAAGHSLGEYSALVAAGAIKFEDAVLLVHKRGTYMQEAVPAGLGKMLAVLGGEVAQIESVIKEVSSGLVQIANINAPGQTVIAGHAPAIEEFQKKMSGAKMMELPVSAPFHCALMKPAEERLAVDLKKLEIRRAEFPVYVNFSAAPLREADEVRNALINQVCGRVRWVECMENALRDIQPDIAVEFGAGNVLSGLLKRINGSIARATVSTVDCPAKVFAK